MNVLAIDPGNVMSGYALIDEEYRPLKFGKIENEILEQMLLNNDLGLCEDDVVVIENLMSYGMPVGRTVLDTAVWIGRFTEICLLCRKQVPAYIFRKEYVTELCGSARAKDSNVTAYLIERFAPDTPNHGKGSVKAKGFFWGFKADIWAAYAQAIYFLDIIKGNKAHM